MKNLENKKDGIELTRENVVGMTVNERLWHADLMNDFDRAISEQNEEQLRNISNKIYLSDENIEVIIQKYIRK